MTVDRARAEAAIAEFLAALGQEGPNLVATPARVIAAFADELLVGDSIDIPDLIASGSELLSGPADPVVLDGLFTATVCPHHLLVAQGQALVAYQPGAKILGLGTVSRLMTACSRRLVLQEQIAQDVVGALMEHAGAQGAFCRLVLNHTCLQARGAEEHAAKTITWAGRGTLKDPRNLEAVLGRSLTGSEEP